MKPIAPPSRKEIALMRDVERGFPLSEAALQLGVHRANLAKRFWVIHCRLLRTKRLSTKPRR